MTREEAIYRLKALLTMCDFRDAFGDRVDDKLYEDAVAMAIEALSSNIVGRCKDCDNWNDGITTYDCYWDKEYHYENPGPDDYCSRWTERKKQ